MLSSKKATHTRVKFQHAANRKSCSAVGLCFSKHEQGTSQYKLHSNEVGTLNLLSKIDSAEQFLKGFLKMDPVSFNLKL